MLTYASPTLCGSQASNLNYGLNVAIRVEEIMNESGGQITDPVEVRLSLSLLYRLLYCLFCGLLLRVACGR